jgi:hypothetical protein
MDWKDEAADRLAKAAKAYPSDLKEVVNFTYWAVREGLKAFHTEKDTLPFHADAYADLVKKAVTKRYISSSIGDGLFLGGNLRRDAMHEKHVEPTEKQSRDYLAIAVAALEELGVTIDGAVLPFVSPFEANSGNQRLFQVTVKDKRLEMEDYHTYELGFSIAFPASAELEREPASVAFNFEGCCVEIMCHRLKRGEKRLSLRQQIEGIEKEWTNVDNLITVKEGKCIVDGAQAHWRQHSYTINDPTKQESTLLIATRPFGRELWYTIDCSGSPSDFARTAPVVWFMVASFEFTGVAEWDSQSIVGTMATQIMERYKDRSTCQLMVSDPKTDKRYPVRLVPEGLIYPSFYVRDAGDPNKPTVKAMADVFPSSTVTKSDVERWNRWAKACPDFTVYVPSDYCTNAGRFLTWKRGDYPIFVYVYRPNTRIRISPLR